MAINPDRADDTEGVKSYDTAETGPAAGKSTVKAYDTDNKPAPTVSRWIIGVVVAVVVILLLVWIF